MVVRKKKIIGRGKGAENNIDCLGNRKKAKTNEGRGCDRSPGPIWHGIPILLCR